MKLTTIEMKGPEMPRATEEEKRQRHPVRPVILKHFTDNPGKVLWVGDFLEILKKQNGDAQRATVQSTIGRLIDDGHPIEVLERANAWVYRPNGSKPNAEKSKTGKRLFEELAVTRGGTILVQDEDGQVYKLTEVE